MATEPEYAEEVDPNEEQDDAESGDQEEQENEGETGALTEEDRHTLETLKKHAPGRNIEEVLRYAQDGVEFNRQRAEEERRMWKEREAEKKAEAPATPEGGTDEDLISRGEARQMVQESRRQERAENTHESCCDKHGLSPQEAYAGRLFVNGAMADKKNKDLTIEGAYDYYVAEILKKKSGEQQDKDEDKAEESKAAIRRSARANRARPPAAVGASTEVPSASGMPSWDDPKEKGWDLFDSEREQRYKQELGVT